MAIIRDADGVQVIELGDTAFVGGYLLTDYDDSARTFRRSTVSAPRVDGEFDVAQALNRVRLTLVIEVDGATKTEARTRKDALLAAVEEPLWFLDMGSSVLWRCAAADSASPRRDAAPDTIMRQVTLTVPAQPRYNY